MHEHLGCLSLSTLILEVVGQAAEIYDGLGLHHRAQPFRAAARRLDPELEVTEPERPRAAWEGCLSLPDLRGAVTRPTAIHVEAYDRKGKKLDFEAKNFHARVIQHEADHLDGVLFVDRMTDMSSLMFLDEFMKYTE